MVKVTWTSQALEDIAEIAEFHERNSYNYAALLVHDFFNVEQKLIQFPNIGRIVPETNTSSIREMIVRNYRIIYSINKPDAVSILTVKSSRKPLDIL